MNERKDGRECERERERRARQDSQGSENEAEREKGRGTTKEGSREDNVDSEKQKNIDPGEQICAALSLVYNIAILSVLILLRTEYC